MNYRDGEHKGLFLSLLERHGRVFRDGRVDSEYAAAYYLLTCNDSVWSKAQRYVDSAGIDVWSLVENESLSSGESLLVRLAGNLFNGSFDECVSPKRLISTLDKEHFSMAMESIRIRELGSQLSLDHFQ